MAQLRTFVRNTFLDIEVASPVEDGEAILRPRFMSDDCSCFTSSSLAASLSRGQDTLSHLDDLINSPLRRMPKWSLSQDCLKTSMSSSSVSTMAVEDWDCKLSSASCEGGSGAASRGFQHCLVPKVLDLVEETGDLPEAAPTTMMIRNIPNRYTQDELIDELERLGFAGSFDFFYAPMDMGTMFCVGYAFVNFVDASSAARCGQVLESYAFARHQKPNRQRLATVSVAHLQGLEANIRHYEKSAVSKKARAKRSGPVIMPTTVVHA